MENLTSSSSHFFNKLDFEKYLINHKLHQEIQYGTQRNITLYVFYQNAYILLI